MNCLTLFATLLSLLPCISFPNTNPSWGVINDLDFRRNTDIEHSNISNLFLDNFGKTWAIIETSNNDIIDNSFYLVSNDKDNSWKLEKSLPTTYYNRSVGDARGRFDHQNRLIITYKRINKDFTFQAKELIRSSDGIWGYPEVIYSSQSFFQRIRTGLDFQGNRPMIIQRDSTSTSYLVGVNYSINNKNWGKEIFITNTSNYTYLANIVQSKNGDHLYLYYLLKDNINGKHGIYVHKFNSSTLNWDLPTYIPNSHFASFGYASSSSDFPAVVDNKGNLTILWCKNKQERNERYILEGNTIVGSRLSHKQWKNTELFFPKRSLIDLTNFSAIDINKNGDVIGAIAISEDELLPDGSNNVLINIVNYSSKSGWIKEIPYKKSVMRWNKLQINFTKGKKAVLTFQAIKNNILVLQSLNYDGEKWDNKLLSPTDNLVVKYHNTISDNNGNIAILTIPRFDSDIIKSVWYK